MKYLFFYFIIFTLKFNFYDFQFAKMFLQSLTTSLAVLVKDLSSLLVNNFSEIFKISFALAVDGFNAFLLRLNAQYNDFIRFLQIEVLSVLNAGKIYCKCDSLIERSSFL